MRDFRDAKVMARALREALKAKGVDTTHSESLELIATAFGYENWNVLSAKIEAAAGPASQAGSPPTQEDPAPPKKTLYCSFCGKSQHEVRKLVAGPKVFICDECVVLCTDIIEPDDDSELFRRLKESEGAGAQDYPALLELARGTSTEELAHYVERSKKGVERSRSSLHFIQSRLAILDDASVTEDTSQWPRELRDKESLMAMQRERQRELKRYEDVLGLAMTVLGERRQ